MEGILIDLLALFICFGPLYFALNHQEKKEKEEFERGKKMIKMMCERVKNVNK